MGCDIHLLVERRVKRGDGMPDQWVAVRTLRHITTQEPGAHALHFESPAALARNYKRFADLAGVRGDGPKARGLPPDASDTAQLLYRIDGDHTPSWLPMDEACRVFLATEFSDAFRAKVGDYPSYYYFGIEPECDGPVEDHRIVFWFDS